MESKEYTIRHIEFSGKWAEFWFEEEHKSSGEEGTEHYIGDQWAECCKIYMLDEVIEKAGITPYELQMKGYHMLIGMKLTWKGDRPIELNKMQFES